MDDIPHEIRNRLNLISMYCEKASGGNWKLMLIRIEQTLRSARVLADASERGER